MSEHDLRPPLPPPSLRTRAAPEHRWWRALGTPLTTAAWVAVVAMIGALGSERMYWYWAGIDAESMSILTAFYATGVAAALFAMALAPARHRGHIVIAAAVYALVIEGVITPVTYEDGPLPVLFFMFVGVHGMLAFGFLFLLLRRWALDGRRRALGGACWAMGTVWGVWALSSGVIDRTTAAEAAADGGSAAVLEPGEFAVYAGWVGVLLVVGHLLLGWLWPAAGWRPSKRSIIGLGVVLALLGAVMVLPAVPWAPLKFGVLATMLWWLLRADRHVVDRDTPTVLDAYAGRVAVRDVAPMIALPISAALTYAAMWPIRGEETALGAMFWTLVGLQVAVGAIAFGWAVYRIAVVPGRAQRRMQRAVVTER